MAFIKGESLKERIESGPLEVNEALDFAVQIAEGLQEAHEKGIVHRDIKPSNIMLTEKGQVKITDFGLAKLEWGVDLTKTATILGTVAYMSPEQAKGEKVDLRTDIWSLGCVLYEILSRERPFQTHQDQATIYSILHEEPTPIAVLKKDVPVDLQMIIHKCLRKNFHERYQNMGELLEELHSVELKFGTSQPLMKFSEKETAPSIAVMPFVNMSADPENEYFSDGLSEELINALTKIEKLRVVARTSSFAFKGEKIDLREVGQKLNVKTLLEGSVRKAGNRVRITAQLISVEDGYHIWSERFDRNMEDVFAIQDEITEKIVTKLKASLDVPVESQEVRRPENMEAFDLYLRGRYYWNNFSPEVINKIVNCYEQAIDKDPNYALAYAALAEVYVMLASGFDILPSREAMPKARKAALKALEIDPTLAEAHVSLGLVATWYDWDRKAAKKHFQKALELNPDSVGAHQWIECYLTFLEGEFDKGIAHLQRAQELDPLNLLIKNRLGYMYYYLRDFERSIDLFQKIVDLEPNNPLAYHGLMDAYGQKGMYEEAVTEGEKALAMGVRAVAHLGVLGFYYALAGKKEKADELLTELKERSKKGCVSSFWVGTIHLGLGETDKAFAWFEKAYQERDSNLIYITIPPPFDSIRPDSRFKQLMKKMGLENLLEKLGLEKNP
jgi:serine/threonine-protein kinase